MPEIKFFDFELPGGIAAHVCPSGKFKTTTIRLFLHHPLTEADVTRNALYPNVLRRGTRRLPTTRDISRQMESLYGARAATEVTKRGEDHVVGFGIDVIDDHYVPGGGKLLFEGLQALKELITDPLVVDDGFRQDYVDGEKEILRREIEGLINDKASYAAWRCIEETTQGDPYSLLPSGRVEDLDDITGTDLLTFYRRALAEDPLDLYLIGDVIPEAVQRTLEQVFAMARPGGGQRPKTVVRRGTGAEREIVERQDINQGKLVLGCLTGIAPGDELHRALSVYNGILGAFPHSKLFRNVRERASLCYYAMSGLERNKGLLLIQSGIEIDKYDAALAIIREQMEAIAKGDISDDELAYTKRAMRTRLEMIDDSAGQIINFHLEGVVSGRSTTIDDELRSIEGVTRDDVVAAAQAVSLETIYFLRDKGGER